MLTVKKAAELVGRTKSALNQKIKNGKLSATRDSNGYWQIDPSELERVFGKLTSNNQKELSTSNRVEHDSSDSLLLEQLKSQLEQQAREIEEWKRRYDKADQERKEATEKVTALLTDQRDKPRGLLGKIFGL